MSHRYDASLIPGAHVFGDGGLGVIGSLIPASGDNGAGYAYNDLSFPADNFKEICGRITSWPSDGTLYTYEDTSFEFSGAADGTYTFQYQLCVDGVATGSPTIVTLQVGPIIQSGSANAGTGVSAGSGSGGVGSATQAGSANAGTGVSTGSGSGGVGSATQAGSANAGTGVSAGSGSGGVGSATQSGAAEESGGTGIGIGSGSGGVGSATQAGSANAGTGVSTGSGSGGSTNRPKKRSLVEKALDNAISDIRRIAPDSIINGKLVKITDTFTASNNKTVKTEALSDVEVIGDSVKQEEVSGFGFLLTDFKFHVIAPPTTDISFYDHLRVENRAYPNRNLRIISKKDYVYGVKSVLFTIIAR